MRQGDKRPPAHGSEPDAPVELAALRADDALIDALAAGLVGVPAQRADAEDELVAMLAAWVDDVRRPDTLAKAAPPDTAPSPEPHPAPVPVAAAPIAAVPIAPVPIAPAPIAPATIAVMTLPAPAHRWLHARSVVVAAAMAVLACSGLAIGAWDARPGETLWTVSKAFYAERAASVEAAADVTTGLAKARAELGAGRRAEAAAAVAAVRGRLDEVGPDEGHDILADEHQRLVEEVSDPSIRPTSVTTSTPDPGSDQALAAGTDPRDTTTPAASTDPSPHPAPGETSGTVRAATPAGGVSPPSAGERQHPPRTSAPVDEPAPAPRPAPAPAPEAAPTAEPEPAPEPKPAPSLEPPATPEPTTTPEPSATPEPTDTPPPTTEGSPDQQPTPVQKPAGDPAATTDGDSQSPG